MVHPRERTDGATMTGAEIEAEYQWNLTLREEAHEGWRRVAAISTLVAEQSMQDTHRGAVKALSTSFVSATQRTREAVAQYRAWLIKQQGGAS
jgi:hypothetical protein